MMRRPIDTAVLLQIALEHLRRAQEYDPYANFPTVSDRKQFVSLLQADPAFNVLGMANERYVIARVGGNLITSLHRKIGDMYEALFTELITRRFDLESADLNYTVDVQIGDRTQTRSTDGVIWRPLLNGIAMSQLPKGWEDREGLGFELRSCYQIGDSKRIQADYDMALALTAQDLLPVMLVFCNTSLRSPLTRLSQSWQLFEGDDTFTFIAELTGFNLRQFMIDNSATFTTVVERALSKL